MEEGGKVIILETLEYEYLQINRSYTNPSDFA